MRWATFAMRVESGSNGLDTATVAAIATVAAVVNVEQHEATHALTCPLVGGRLEAFSALYVVCASPDLAAAKLVAGIGDVALVLVGWASRKLGGTHRRSPPPAPIRSTSSASEAGSTSTDRSRSPARFAGGAPPIDHTRRPQRLR